MEMLCIEAIHFLTLVEPQVLPPGHGDQVPEPHVRQLVGNDLDHAVPKKQYLYCYTS